jgi:signal transduction histidine kinase
VLKLVKKELENHRINVNRHWANHLPPIPAKADYLKQVFLNLILNAIDAMAENGGTLSIETKTEPSSTTGQKTVPGVHISFTDTGIGIPADIQGLMFEPLFTTKDKGSGLGLFTSYKIIKAHQGDIRVYSQEGAGATITLFLPLSLSLPSHNQNDGHP